MDVDRELSRLRWRCRRGMRELDELLLRYVERRCPKLSRGERDAFAAYSICRIRSSSGILPGADRAPRRTR